MKTPNSAPLFNGFFLSSGTGVIWGNSAPTGYETFVSIHSMRRDATTYAESATPDGWGYCGTSSGNPGAGSPWDENVDASNGGACIDQPGRGKGDLLSGEFPNAINTATSSIHWPNQALEPIYEWNDSWAPVPGYPYAPLNNYNPEVLVENRDFYLSAASFTGTSGVGSGALSSRPTTCNMNVAYWASDTNTLYQCRAGNTWVPYYMPYAYPHPLVHGMITPPPTAPAAPTNLHVTVH
jgi:hypothetical protein